MAAMAACSADGDLPAYETLQQLAKDYQGAIVVERERDAIGDLGARILRFEVDGLEQYALAISPTGPVPERGWPVLIFNHGYVPVPADHGLRKSTGKRDRPGDYYRGIPEGFARNGFLVIAPDYRGHADSQGAEFVKASSPLSSLAWYSRDVVALVVSLGTYEPADESRVFMLGHSMGGAITLNAVSVLGDKIKAASLWSTSSSRYFETESAQKATRFKLLSTPLNFHHAVGDSVTPLENAQNIAQRLPKNSGKLYTYAGEQHLLDSENRAKAFQRDISFFRKQ